MKKVVAILLCVLAAAALAAGLRFEAPAVDVAEVDDGYSMRFPEGGTIYLSSLQIRAEQIALLTQGKKIGEARLRQARFEGSVGVVFPEANRITADRGTYEEPVFKLDGDVRCAIGEWKCEAARVVFLTDTNTLELEEGKLTGEAIRVSARRLVFPLIGSVRAEGEVAVSASGLVGECKELVYDPETKEAALKEATVTAADRGISLKGAQVRLRDNLSTILVSGDIEAVLGAPE
jgi:lipopolysaccharide assembly outer membrane protein LptD (OstA)